MKCFECAGTGAACPDCWLCEGRMTVHWRRAVRQGWRKGDLDLEAGSDYVTCPRDECRGDLCGMCEGDGRGQRGRFQIEVTRVLVFGLKQRLPPVVERRTWDPRKFARAYAALDAPGRFNYANSDPPIIEHERMLSAQAARYCMEKRWGNRLNSIFGHEFYLTPKGQREAERRYGHWLNWLSGVSLQHWLDWIGEDERRPNYWDPPPVDHAGLDRLAVDGGLADA